MADKQVKLKITSAIAIGGKIQRPGAVVSVAEDVAKNLLHRGRAELATAQVSDKPSESEIDAELAEMSEEILRAEAEKRKIKGHAKMDVDALKAAIKSDVLG